MTTRPAAPRYLTKSRFKMAMQCPTKLSYTGNADYANASLDNSFLAALAEGGYQVGALACAMFPGGVEVDAREHDAQLGRTRELLLLEDVTIYEAALEAHGLFVRVDILRKRGRTIELIEVKAKSYHPGGNGAFRNRSGQIDGAMLPYLQDIAFQRHVAGLAFPQFDYRCFLMLADTSRVAGVDGLNDRFRIVRDGARVHVETATDTTVASLGEPILSTVAVDEHVGQILDGALDIGAADPVGFAKGVRLLADAYQQDRRIAPRPSPACGSCEFKAARPAQGPGERSGFHECWQEAFGLDAPAIAAGTVLDLWNFRGKRELIDRGVVRLSQVTQDDVGFDGSQPGRLGMSAKHRQWYQVSGAWPDGGAFYLDRSGLEAARQKWRFPLHFIDFETSAVPIPFVRGRAPYQTTAFQFSHHVMHADGRVEHASQFLDATPGVHPNIDFLRALHHSLAADEGTVFRWAAHENTVLCQLRDELLDSPAPPPDTTTLVAFVDSLTTRSDGGATHAGPRAMVDLCKLAELHFFHPATRGSSSLKKVLPALMRSSAFLRGTYGQPVYGKARMPSLNFAEPVVWWQERDDEVCDPYRLLPPIFAELTPDDQDALDAGLAAQLKDGGAAMAAYAQLQSRTLPISERADMMAALLRYCELDTLAMVMTVQAWNAWLDTAA